MRWTFCMGATRCSGAPKRLRNPVTATPCRWTATGSKLGLGPDERTKAALGRGGDRVSGVCAMRAVGDRVWRYDARDSVGASLAYASASAASAPPSGTLTSAVADSNTSPRIRLIATRTAFARDRPSRASSSAPRFAQRLLDVVLFGTARSTCCARSAATMSRWTAMTIPRDSPTLIVERCGGSQPPPSRRSSRSRRHVGH